MKIGNIQTHESLINSSRPSNRNPDAQDDLSISDSVGTDSDGIFDAVNTMENEEFKAQQMDLLQNSLDVIKESKEVSPEQVRVLAIQLSVSGKYIPSDQKFVIDSLLSQKSEDRQKNAVITTEALGIALGGLGAVLLAFSFILFQLFQFFKIKKVSEHQRSVVKRLVDDGHLDVKNLVIRHLDVPFPIVSEDDHSSESVCKGFLQQLATKVKASSLEGIEEWETQSTDSMLVVGDRVSRIINGIALTKSVAVTQSDIEQAVKLYQKYSQLGEINQALASGVVKQLAQVEKYVSQPSNVTDGHWVAVVDAITSELEKSSKLMERLADSSQSSDIKRHTNNEYEGKLLCLPLIKGAMSPAFAVDGYKIKNITVHNENFPLSGFSLSTDQVHKLRASLEAFPIATLRVERAAKDREKLGEQVEQLARKTKSSGKNQTLAVPKEVVASLAAAKRQIFAIDRIWLEVCQDMGSLVGALRSSRDLQFRILYRLAELVNKASRK